MRIFIITEAPDRPERALIDGLAEAGHRVHAFTGHTSSPLSSGVCHTTLRIRSRMDLAASKTILRSARNEEVDLIHAFTGQAVTAALRVKKKIGCKVVAYRGVVGSLSQLDPSAHMSFLHPDIDAVSCVSEAVRRYLLQQGLPPHKAVTIYKGHDVAWYAPATRAALRGFDVPDNSFTIACIANVRRSKGIEVLFEALRLLHDPDLHLLLIGALGDLELQRQAHKLKVHTLGFREDAVALLGACDVAVVPSIGREGLPKVLLEAMSLSKPVVATRVAGIPEVIEHENSGLLIPQSDPRILARAMAFLKREAVVCRTLGDAAKIRVQTHFTVEDTIARTLELYTRVLAASDRHRDLRDEKIQGEEF